MDVLGASHADIAHEYGLSNNSIPRLIAYLRASGRTLRRQRRGDLPAPRHPGRSHGWFP
jgi:hypothetical protein